MAPVDFGCEVYRAMSSRRRCVCVWLAILGSGVVGFPGAAVATPAVSFRAQLVPIPGYPRTGDAYGAGADAVAEYQITGTEYRGAPQPLAGLNLFLPARMRLDPVGFATCPPSALEPTGKGPGACPPMSRAGPQTAGTTFAWLEGVRTEPVTVEPFFAPGGGIELFLFGHTPFNREVLAVGKLANVAGVGGFGPEFELSMSRTFSAQSIQLRVGAAAGPSNPKEASYYIRLPRRRDCPKGGFRAKSELIFAAVEGLRQRAVTTESRIPCPKRSRK
jgi:hypothetical protein